MTTATLESRGLRIVTNNVPRPLLTFRDLPASVFHQFVARAERQGWETGIPGGEVFWPVEGDLSFFWYRRGLYHLHANFVAADRALFAQGWHLREADAILDAMLVRLIGAPDQVIIGRIAA